jgi:hypothetical protein
VKKLLILLVLIVSIGPAAFSLSESSLGLGFGWGNFFERASSNGSTAKTYMSSPGIAFNGYSFWNKKNIGLFTNMAFLFPSKSTIDINGVKTNADLSFYDILFQFNAMIGPGFRINIRENFILQLGVGLNYMQTTGSYTGYVAGNKIGYGLLAYNLGLGGDIGIKYDITDAFFISAGSTVSYDFACHTAVFSSYENTSGWAGNYSMLGIRPYLCIGMNFWAGEPGFFKTRIGKPR